MKLFFRQKKAEPSLPLVSIITATYNAAETLERTIGSVVQQIYKNIEFIIIDGLSGDNTLPVVKAAAKKDKRIRFLSEKDQGAYDAMNKGISMCRGDWIYFLGADDMLINENILQELFDSGYFNQDKVFYGNVMIEGDTSWAKDREIYAGEFDLARLLEQNICHQAIFYPRTMIRKAGLFNTEYTVCADWDYNLRCYALSPFLYVDKVIARFRGGGISTVIKTDPFLEDLPGNIISCFSLDPGDPNLVIPGSPFRKIIENYSKLQEKKTNQQNSGQ